jgi:hypothetical protein
MTTTSIDLPLLIGAPACFAAAPRGAGAGSASDIAAAGRGPNGSPLDRGSGSASCGPSAGPAPAVRDLVLLADGGGYAADGPVAISTYLAQHIAQERLSHGLYLDPHPAGTAAYRDVLLVVAGARTARPAGLDILV